MFECNKSVNKAASIKYFFVNKSHLPHKLIVSNAISAEFLKKVLMFHGQGQAAIIQKHCNSYLESDCNCLNGNEINLFPICHASAFIAIF